MINNVSLRVRITALVGIVVILISVVLTMASIRGAQDYFSGTMLNKTIVDDEYSKKFRLEHEMYGQQENNSSLSNISVTTRVVEAQKKFSNQSLAMMTIIIVMGIGTTYLLVGRALRPLTKLNEAVKGIHELNLEQRIPVLGSKDELGSLSVSFNRMLDRLDRSFARQRRFAADAAHELKTPLTTIKTSLQVLQLDHSPTLDDYKLNAEVIQQSTDRLIQVADHLLELAVEDHTTFDDRIEIYELCKRVTSELQPLADHHQVSIVVHSCACHMNGNYSMLYSAVCNLATNAIKYNKAGGKVELQAFITREDLTLTVSDQGIGIPEQELDLIFEPFYRVDKSRSRAIGGTGLGLALVKTIIAKHHGTIQVQSIEGMGTTMQVTLPIRQVIQE
ncbi:sensor histidine kinase [Paenibacillus taiwanensis]|uniref:sensor histidine kinase n=1 Tax=Paenibacillus taiwanensis TaxID=401638 RepID=UPI0004136F26|nr:HAMP domain-containing sensor histidine kinase [Paenibacillus taiwanensis]